MNTFPRDIFDMGEKSDLMVQEAYQSDPFDGELNWIREDIPAAIIEKSSVVMEETRNEDSDFDYRKGKEVDGETQVAIDKLQESIEKSAEAAKETFHSLFGKESPTPRSSTSTYAPAHLKVRNENDHNQDDDLYGDQDDDDLQDDQNDDDQEDVQDDDDLQEDDFHDHDPEHDEYYDDQH
ncbi:hypothetical protein P8452_55070 [Trifolium repens]|nr:hypothetical protein P8452_55070 [Trifolium repens]